MMIKLSMFCFLPILAVHLSAQDRSAIKDSEDILNQFVLVRPPDYAGGCFDSVNASALLIFTAATPPMMIGTQYQIITNSGQPIAGSLVELVPADSCGGPFTEMTSAVSFGALHVTTTLDWKYSLGAMIAIPTKVRKPNNIGTVNQYDDAALLKACKAIIKPLVPDSVHFDFASTRLITTPDTHKHFIFIGVERYPGKERRLADDKDIEYTGFVFSLARRKARLLIKEDGLENIFTISDLNGNGEYELGFSSGGSLSIGYGVRIFDGKQFKGACRFLYQAGD